MVARQPATLFADTARLQPQGSGHAHNSGRPTRQATPRRRRAWGVPAHRIARVVPVRDAQGYAIVVTARSRRLELDRLNQEFKRRFVRARVREIDQLLPDRCARGLPPLGPNAGLETYLDEALLTVGDVFVETCDGRHLVPMEGEAFRELLYGAWCGRFSRAA